MGLRTLIRVHACSEHQQAWHLLAVRRCQTAFVRFTTAEISAATGGVVRGPHAVINGVSIDSRSVRAGELFVPIVAERDGHGFIESAAKNGATAWLTSDTAVSDRVDGAAVVVNDTTRALADLARAARARHAGPVIAITGSVGKTSVKDLTLAALGPTAHGSDRSFNNELGVPLTLCNAPDHAEYLVLEMGSRGVGHIAHLCSIASPTIGVVTWVGAVHTSEFGDLDTVARAKAELIHALPADGVAILNAECGPVAAMASSAPASVVLYDATGSTPAAVSARGIVIDEDLCARFDAVVEGSTLPVRLSVHGVHQVSNALGALAVCSAVHAPLDRAVLGLGTAELSPWRMELHRTPSGGVVINDAYNANAISTAAALHSLAALDATRRVAVLGVMAELGDRHQTDHQAMTALCGELDIELLAFREAAYGREVLTDADQVCDAIGPIGADDAVLVKGSRVAGLESLAARLLM